MKKICTTVRYQLAKLRDYHISTYAASASFFIITAVIPLLVLLLFLLDHISISIEEFIDMATEILPTIVGDLLYQYVEEFHSTEAISISLIILLWTASKSMLGLIDGLNAIAGVNDTRNFLFKRLICIGYTFALIIALLIHLSIRVFGHHIGTVFLSQAPEITKLFFISAYSTGLTLILLLTLLFALIYTVFPNKELRFRAQLPGALLASVGWLGFSTLFSIYINQHGNLSSLYGSLSAIIFAMLWLYCCMYILFLGAVFNLNYVLKFKRLITFTLPLGKRT